MCSPCRDHRLTRNVLDGATPVAMRDLEGAPQEEQEEEDDESNHVPSRLEEAKMMLEMVWIIARLLGM